MSTSGLTCAVWLWDCWPLPGPRSWSLLRHLAVTAGIREGTGVGAVPRRCLVPRRLTPKSDPETVVQAPYLSDGGNGHVEKSEPDRCGTETQHPRASRRPGPPSQSHPGYQRSRVPLPFKRMGRQQHGLPVVRGVQRCDPSPWLLRNPRKPALVSDALVQQVSSCVICSSDGTRYACDLGTRAWLSPTACLAQHRPLVSGAPAGTEHCPGRSPEACPTSVTAGSSPH